MKIKSMKFFEGFNITGQKHTLRLIAADLSALEALKYTNIYIDVCSMIGFKERVLDIKENAEEITIWVSYSQQEVSEFIWTQLESGQSCFDTITKEALKLKEQHKEKALEFIKGKPMKNIPVFAVTGTNGKTTTSRLLYHMLMKLGYNAGLANTGSIMVGKDRVETGDTTGFLSSRRLLSDKRVEAAVLETARGGIINNGLGFEEIDGAIITSLSEDHLGLSGINNLKELIKVKTVILKGVRRRGHWVLRAQREILEEAEKNLEGESFVQKALLFDIHKNPFIEKHIALGGEAMYVEGSCLVHYKSGTETKIAEVIELAFTNGGLSLSNTLNVMAVLLALSSIGKDMLHLVDLIKTIPCDIIHNPGRQNILELGGIRVLLDYGHNAEAYEAVYSIVEGLLPSRVISIITAPGDRQDKHIEELGYISGSKSSNIIIREQKDGRGSERGRVASLMTKGALRAGRKEEEISYESQAGDALVHALERAVKGEIIVIFTEYLQPVIEKLNEYIKASGKGEALPIPLLSL